MVFVVSPSACDASLSMTCIELFARVTLTQCSEQHIAAYIMQHAATASESVGVPCELASLATTKFAPNTDNSATLIVVKMLTFATTLAMATNNVNIRMATDCSTIAYRRAADTN